MAVGMLTYRTEIALPLTEINGPMTPPLVHAPFRFITVAIGFAMLVAPDKSYRIIM
jgi:hypothetical protein